MWDTRSYGIFVVAQRIVVYELQEVKKSKSREHSLPKAEASLRRSNVGMELNAFVNHVFCPSK